ncbi:MAG: P-loop NTPase fold protein [Candidatus Cloacimonetes bacterium]|nr:P-loop NTPase fold protein [Candidatus Cloacimonadota bacterium]
MTNKKTDKGLKLLNDSVYDQAKDKDAFDHNVYAKLLAKIFHPPSGNDPGISVALFGKWGQGKSSVVQMMEDELAKNIKDNKVKVIWFNAWKTRGDHVRRQLLLSIIKGIDSPKFEQISKFVQPGNPLQIRSYDVQDEVNNKAKWLVMAQNEKIDAIATWAFIIGAISLTLWIISLFVSTWSAKLSILPLQTFIVSTFTYFWRYFSAKKEKILTSAEPVSDSQRLKYPDQFQLVFEEELAEYKDRDGTPIVVVVDDLDRCEAGTVVEALACIRQLGGKPLYEEEIAECRFLVPCDEKQVLSALKDDGHHNGYEEEDLLRKFFDVIVRMDALLPDDMVAYAGKLSERFNEFTDEDTELIQELIGAVAPRNPRQVKKLINAYILFKEKIKISPSLCSLCNKEILKHVENTSLLVIALQETLPDIYQKLMDNPDEFQKLHDINDIDNSEDTQHLKNATHLEKKAARIIQALEPISHHTFKRLTRKGIPEALAGLENGPEIHESIQSGDEEAFEKEISKANEIDKIAFWLKQYRKSCTSIAQFRYALSCLIKPESLSPQLTDVINDYIKRFQKFKDAMKGYNNLLKLAHITVNLGPCKRKIHSTVISNFRELKTDDALTSDELKSIFIFGDDLSDSAEKLFTQHICPMFHLSSTEPKEKQHALKVLTALNNALPKNKLLNLPELATTIAKGSMWEIYATNAPDANKGLHSSLINTLIGDKEEDLSQLVDILFEGNGPLGQQIDLKTQSQRGEREAISTISAISPRLPSDTLQKVYIKLKPWLDIQADQQNFMFIANAFSTQWPRLPEKQIKELAALMTAHCINSNKPEWLIEYVESADPSYDETVTSERVFCQASFNYLKQKQLNQPTINATSQNFLNTFTENSWPITEDADSALANAIKTIIVNPSSWESWRTSLWPLAISTPTETAAAIYEQLANNKMPGTYIPFAVEEICSGKLSSSLKMAMKQYFCLHPNTTNEENFTSIFNDENVTGAEQVIELIIDDLDAAKTNLDEPRIVFISNNLKGLKEDSIQLFFKYIRRQYLQEANLTQFYTGVKHAVAAGNIPSEIKGLIKERALEQSVSLTPEQKELTTKALGKNLFKEKKV